MGQRPHAPQGASSRLSTDNIGQLDVNLIYQFWQLPTNNNKHTSIKINVYSREVITNNLYKTQNALNLDSFIVLLTEVIHYSMYAYNSMVALCIININYYKTYNKRLSRYAVFTEPFSEFR